MTQQQRLLLAIALSFGLMLAFTNFVTKPAAEEEAARLAALDAGARLGATEVTDGAVPLPVLAALSPAAADSDAGIPSAGAAVAPAAPLRLVDVERPTTQLTFTSEGAGLTNAILKGPRERVEQALSITDGYKKMLGGKFPPPAQVDMAEPVPSGAPQLAISIAGVTPVAATQRYAVAEEGPGLLGFVATVGPLEIHKVFRWSATATTSEKDPTGYLSTLEVTVKNTSSTPAGGDLTVHTTRSIAPGSEESPSMFGGIGNESSVVCQVGDDTKRERPSDDAVAHEDKGAVSFVGIDQTYFLTAVWPIDGAADGRCVLTASKLARSAELAVPLTLQAGQAVTKTFGVFIGPKDLELLTAIAKHAPAAGATFDPRLDKTVDFGWWAAICRILIFFLRMFHNLAGNWGVAIILLTVMVKVLLLPLTHKAMLSAEQMKKLSPRMEELKKKYPDDRDRQNTEMMKLYQEAKVNPLGGCLPLLVQLPIWAALFTTLRTSYELYGEPFFGVWSDLTSKDPTYLLPLALGVTMIVTQRLQPQMTMDKSQAFLMAWVMPIFFTAIMINYPAGLALYIFTNNLLSIVQQYALRKYMARTQAVPAGAAR